MTVLTIAQAVARRLSISVPETVVSATDDSALQILEFLTESCEDLQKAHDWSKLRVVRTFTCGASNEQTSELQTDFDRLAHGTQMWNDTRNWPIYGPVTAEDWNDLIIRTVQALPQHWRIIGGQLNIYSPQSGDSMRYEYISKNYVFLAGVEANDSATITNDTDTFVFPDELLKRETLWRWKQAKGLDYAEDMASAERFKINVIASDVGGTRVLQGDREPYFVNKDVHEYLVTP